MSFMECISFSPVLNFSDNVQCSVILIFIVKPPKGYFSLKICMLMYHDMYMIHNVSTIVRYIEFSI